MRLVSRCNPAGTQLFRGYYLLVGWMFSWNRRGGIVEFVEKIYKRTLFYISCYLISGHFVKSPRNAQVTSAEELGTMSKNNLREITLGIRPYVEDSLSYPLSSLVLNYENFITFTFDKPTLKITVALK